MVGSPGWTIGTRGLEDWTDAPGAPAFVLDNRAARGTAVSAATVVVIRDPLGLWRARQPFGRAVTGGATDRLRDVDLEETSRSVEAHYCALSEVTRLWWFRSPFWATREFWEAVGTVGSLAGHAAFVVLACSVAIRPALG